MSENEIITDNAEVILENLKEGILSPRALTQDMRRICVEYLHRQGDKVYEEMAEILHVSTKTIQRDIEAIEQGYANMLTLVDYKRVVGGLLYKARNLTQKAMKKEDYRLVWQIEMDLIDKFMELGFLNKMPEEMIVKTEKTDDFTAAEIIDVILMNVAERRNKRENAGLTGDGQAWLTGGDNGDNGDGGDDGESGAGHDSPSYGLKD